MPAEHETPRGRGTGANPPNRFDLLHYERDPAAADEDAPAPATQFFRDQSRSIIAYNDSPDIPFSASLNVYRGCEHGCVYCYARPMHEYLGFSAGLDFETRIMVKENAPQLLRKELSARSWQPQVVAVGTATDSYQPIERKLQLTRRCLEVFLEFGNPMGLVTKNHLVSRDRDLLGELARRQAALVFVSITTLDADLARRLEPRASQPLGRLAAIEELTAAGVPVGVMLAPMIPGLNDHEIPAILTAAGQAGARFAGFVLLRLPHGVGELFERWLEEHYPLGKERVLNRLRDMRGGHLYEARFGSRMVGQGAMAEQMKALFHLGCRRAGLDAKAPELSTARFRRPGGTQRSLFDDC
jgi:DNA repair photolyase